MFHPVSPPVYVYTKDKKGDTTAHTVFGWFETNGIVEPVVGNPDGPGAGRWSIYHGTDPWYAR